MLVCSGSTDFGVVSVVSSDGSHVLKVAVESEVLQVEFLCDALGECVAERDVLQSHIGTVLDVPTGIVLVVGVSDGHARCLGVGVGYIDVSMSLYHAPPSA